MKLIGLPRPRRPPAPASAGMGARGWLAPVATAEPRPRPPLPAPTAVPLRACSRFDPARAGLDCVLFVSANGHPFRAFHCARLPTRETPQPQRGARVPPDSITRAALGCHVLALRRSGAQR